MCKKQQEIKLSIYLKKLKDVNFTAFKCSKNPFQLMLKRVYIEHKNKKTNGKKKLDKSTMRIEQFPNKYITYTEGVGGCSALMIWVLEYNGVLIYAIPSNKIIHCLFLPAERPHPNSD
jgi:hypothetical protein